MLFHYDYYRQQLYVCGDPWSDICWGPLCMICCGPRLTDDSHINPYLHLQNATTITYLLIQTTHNLHALSLIEHIHSSSHDELIMTILSIPIPEVIKWLDCSLFSDHVNRAFITLHGTGWSGCQGYTCSTEYTVQNHDWTLFNIALSEFQIFSFLTSFFFQISNLLILSSFFSRVSNIRIFYFIFHFIPMSAWHI